MGIRLGIVKELREGENRVALSPESLAKLNALGFEIYLQNGAGLGSFFSDAQYEQAGARLEPDPLQVYSQSQIILKVNAPQIAEIGHFPANCSLISFILPLRHPEVAQALQAKAIQTFAMEQIPRITRAQSMDALSSQATIAGYRAALLAAEMCPRFFPMLTTAAGTLRPAKVLVMGAGVAGLQAIATARRLGAIVEGYDVRVSAREQVESLGARFVSSSVNAEAQGGYARELSAEEKAQDQAILAEHVAKSDVVITTAQVPGRQAPLLVSEMMISKMRPGSLIVDLAAENGGNCCFTRPREMVEKNGVRIFGPVNLPSEMPVHATEMYSKNLFHFLNHLTQSGKSLEFNFEDEIVSGALLFPKLKILGGQ